MSTAALQQTNDSKPATAAERREIRRLLNTRSGTATKGKRS